MQTGITITTRQVKIIAFVTVLAIAVYALAGNPYPDAPPGSTMKTLEQVYAAASGGILERQGYSKFYEGWVDVTVDILTVPAGKCFVLLKFQGENYTTADSTKWNLLAREPDSSFSVILNGAAIRHGHVSGTYQNSFWWDFPDRCIVLQANQTLQMQPYGGHACRGHVVGYFYDAP